jgi:hypothetical protein
MTAREPSEIHSAHGRDELAQRRYCRSDGSQGNKMESDQTCWALQQQSDSNLNVQESAIYGRLAFIVARPGATMNGAP